MVAASDFFTVEVWTRLGLVRSLVFFVIDLSTRRVQVGGMHPAPNGEWMNQAGRNLTDADDGFLPGAGVKTVNLPPRSPNLSAYAERTG